MRRGLLAAVIAHVALTGGAVALAADRGAISPDALQKAHADARGRVVGVSFTLKQMESEAGVEGPRAEGNLCGVVAGPRTIIVTGDIFPEPGGDPRTTMAPATFEVHLGPDRIIPARAIGLDRKLNLAFLQVEPADAGKLNPVTFRADPPLAVGDPVMVVGLLSRKYEFAPAIFKSTINATTNGPVPLLGVDSLLQDLTVGGLVLRRDGTAAGVIAKDLITDDMTLTRTPGNFISIIANTGQPPFRRPGYAMVLPYEAFSGALESPPPVDLDSEFKRAWLGIVMQALDEDLRDYWELPVPGGIIVGSVIDGSPAKTAGIRQGDVITRFDGDPLRITENAQLGDFRRRVERMDAGQKVVVQVYRDGKPLDLDIHLGDAPTSASLAEDFEDEDFGLTVRELTVDVQQAMNLEADLEGVLIESTENSGWADVAGLFPQDIILAINGVKVASVGDVRDALADIKHRQDPEAIFFVMRPPDTLFLRVRTEFGGTAPAGSNR
jgi:S1-C subfamily serine protease